MKILFQGDSITDAGRSRENLADLGPGYPATAAALLTETFPQTEFTFINRGISGNRIVDLYARIKMDVWNLQPDVLSILIGINDIWHEVGINHNGVDLVRFERMYRMMLDDTLERLPNLKLIICIYIVN
jgi:lysophospholipase L1-like esterase